MVYCRPTEYLIHLRKYSVGRHDALCWRSKYSDGRQSTLFKMRKHSDGRQDALSNRSMNNLGQEWSFYERSKYSVARHDALFCRSEYYDGRQDAFSNCGNTLSAVRVPYPVEASILSAVRVLPQKEEASCRPSGCFLEYKNSCFAN